MHFKATLEVTSRKSWYERLLYIRSEDIIGAMDITKKIRGARLKKLEPISYKAYMIGVAAK